MLLLLFKNLVNCFAVKILFPKKSIFSIRKSSKASYFKNMCCGFVKLLYELKKIPSIISHMLLTLSTLDILLYISIFDCFVFFDSDNGKSSNAKQGNYKNSIKKMQKIFFVYIGGTYLFLNTRIYQMLEF